MGPRQKSTAQVGPRGLLRVSSALAVFTGTYLITGLTLGFGTEGRWAAVAAFVFALIAFALAVRATVLAAPPAGEGAETAGRLDSDG
jgi:hypothetical protein